MSHHAEPFCLSTAGSTRATAYGFSNKSVTLDGRTHVVWLDAIAQVRGRTFDHETGQWSQTVDIFEGCDNHTSPALTVDREGHIHIVGGPHGRWGAWNQGCFKWFRSAGPNRIDAWTGEANFGYGATYACMAHTPSGLDVIAYRGGETPASVMFQSQRPLGHWSTAREILRQEIEPQYTHTGARVACDGQGVLYVAGHLYNVGGADNPPVGGDVSRMRSHGVAVLRSADMGQTWTDLRGSAVNVPALYEERIAIPPVGADIRLNGLMTDSRDSLWALITSTGAEKPEVLLGRWDGDGWVMRDLAGPLPTGRAAVDAVLAIDRRDRIHVAATTVVPERMGSVGRHPAFGDPSSEVFSLTFDPAADDRECCQASPTDANVPNWLPNLSLPGPFCPVDEPVLLYTHGQRGEGCSPTTETEVYCVLPGAADETAG